METVIFELPECAQFAIEGAEDRDWLLHNFPLSPDQSPYDIGSYLYNMNVNGIAYNAVLDLNVLQLMVNNVKKTSSKPEYKDALWTLIFLQLAQIEVDPTLAIYERANHDAKLVEEALDDLDLIVKLNETNPDILADFARGNAKRLVVPVESAIDREYLRGKILEFRKLIEWDSFYLIVLKTISIQLDADIPTDKKAVALVEWMFFEFRRSLPAIAYGVMLFGRKPLRRMMKYRPQDSARKRRSAVSNMTWDYFHIQKFFHHWVENSDDVETLFVSDDKAFKAVTRLAIEMQNQDSIEPLREHAHKQSFDSIQRSLSMDSDSPKRAYMSDVWGGEYRFSKIYELERHLGLDKH